MPTVLCIYSPTDPIVICERNKANWLAVDCADESKLRWLKPLVNYAKGRDIPVIAWVQNPLSSAIEDFRAAGGQVLTWPAITNTKALPPVGTPIANGLRSVFGEACRCRFHPIVIKNPRTEGEIESLQHAYVAISKAAHLANSANASRLVWGTVQISWKYLRALENLCVPLGLFEDEIQNFWGTSSLGRIRETFNKYLGALTTGKSDLYSLLIDAQGYLQRAHDQFQQQEPPLWEAVANLCIENVTRGTFRLFVFPTNSSKKLFSLGLLAYYNITEEDLRQLGVGLISLRELYDFLTLLPQEETIILRAMRQLAGLPVTDVQWEYWMVGLPSWVSASYLDPVLRQGDLRIVVYPYQVTALARRIEQWELAVSPSISEYANATALIAKQTSPPGVSSSLASRFTLESVQRYEVETAAKFVPVQGLRPGIWEPFDPLEEFSILMRAEIEDEPPSLSPKMSSRIRDGLGDTGIDFVEEVWLVEFTNNEYVLLRTDEKVNVITSTRRGSRTDERFASSLRSGDRIVFIHGQRRQSLLDLVISRVYRHPSVSLHVKLVERWQEDFAIAYQHRAMTHPGLNFDSLLEEMRTRGSGISGVGPLRNWLHGETLRPHDQEDLRRLAEIFRLEFVRQHYKRIHQAGSRLAGLHVSLSRRLNAWLNGDVPDMVAHSPDWDDTIDEQLGLTFEDFRDSLSLLQVKSVRKERGLFGREMLGQLEKGKMN